MARPRRRARGGEALPERRSDPAFSSQARELAEGFAAVADGAFHSSDTSASVQPSGG
jgi:hypothetical protein